MSIFELESWFFVYKDIVLSFENPTILWTYPLNENVPTMTFLLLKSDHVMAWVCMVETCANHLFGVSKSIWKGFLISYFLLKATIFPQSLDRFRKKNQNTLVCFKPPPNLKEGLEVRTQTLWATEALIDFSVMTSIAMMYIIIVKCLKNQHLGKIKVLGFPMLSSHCAEASKISNSFL